MSKTILVMELDEFPKDCSNCPQEWESDCSGRAFCAGTGDSQHEISGDDWNTRPNWCPLIPEPERLSVWVPSRKAPIGQVMEVYYNLGWNACLDALEGKT